MVTATSLRLNPQPVPSVRGHVQHVLPDYPRQVRLESAAHCTMRCAPCHAFGFKKMSRIRGFMDIGLFRTLVEEAGSWPGPLEMVPTNWGEWFLHRDWLVMGMLVDELAPEAKLVVPTNGALLDDSALAGLASLKTLNRVNFSVNAYFAETYERFHGVPGDGLPKIRQAVEQFKDMRPDVTLVVSMVYDPTLQTELERDLFRAFWGQVCQVDVNTASYCNNPARAPGTAVVLPCRSVFDGLTVLWDGKVVSNCCFDAEGELALGSVLDRSLLELWKGDALKELCETHNRGARADLPLCAGCTFA